jgi:hypothetical protein
MSDPDSRPSAPRETHPTDANERENFAICPRRLADLMSAKRKSNWTNYWRPAPNLERLARNLPGAAQCWQAKVLSYRLIRRLQTSLQ